MFEKTSPPADVGRIVSEANTVFDGALFGAVVVLLCGVTFGALNMKRLPCTFAASVVIEELVTAVVVATFVGTLMKREEDQLSFSKSSYFGNGGRLGNIGSEDGVSVRG